ncbi:hypothetical protein MZM54_05130 [[Brevibacterium] frigoritolerans]|nr:hypothetical protein [Peribacillus frigoritolerans]
MSRHIEVTDQSIKLTLDGLTSLMTFKKEVNVPYSYIKNVDTKLPDLPFLWKMFGVNVGGIQEGHFRKNDEYYFFSMKKPENIIVLELVDYKIGKHPYKLMAFEVENPKELRKQIEAKLK